MLCGIGGATVAEARQRISRRELLKWIAFRRKRGTLHPGLRTDEAAARLCVVANRSLGGKAQVHDFLPYHDEKVASVNDVMSMMRGR